MKSVVDLSAFTLTQHLGGFVLSYNIHINTRTFLSSKCTDGYYKANITASWLNIRLMTGIQLVLPCSEEVKLLYQNTLCLKARGKGEKFDFECAKPTHQKGFLRFHAFSNDLLC